MKLSNVYGQNQAVAGLRSWLKSPTSKAFLFSGETGTGKTFTAEIIAHELNAAPGDALGGLVEIPSGEQTAETVRATLRSLHNRPMAGSGWKVLIVNEADFMSPQAQAVWLDGLENLPANTVVVFTTNDPDKLPARFVDRCEHYEFESTAAKLRNAAELLVAEKWQAATGGNHAPTLEDLGAIRAGKLSFRRLVSNLEKELRDVDGYRARRAERDAAEQAEQPKTAPAVAVVEPKRPALTFGQPQTVPAAKTARNGKQPTFRKIDGEWQQVAA